MEAPGKHKISSANNHSEDGLKLPKLELSISDTDELIRQFKSAYEERGNTDLLYQVPYLSQLADIYQQKGDWASLIQAHSLHNSCAVRDVENRAQWQRKAYQVQLQYWQAALQSLTQHLEVTNTMKCELEEVRDKWRRRLSQSEEYFTSLICEPEKLSSIENEELYKQILQDVPTLAQSLNQDMITFSGSVIERALLICGPAPCRLCVVGLGSIAKGEATPYSDLEFLFLIEYKSEDVMQYFQRLAVTIYFFIGNLGETKLKVMAIPELMTWDEGKQKYAAHWFDDAGMSGFKIDGLGSWAGNIPTGGTPEQRNQFICTVGELAGRYKWVLDNPHPAESLTGDLTAMLANTVCIHGDHSLHDDFRSLVNSYQASELRKATTMKMLKKDAAKFDFKPDDNLTVRKQLKSDIYRYPSLLVLNLKILYGILTSNPWEIISLLEKRNVISHSAGKSLKFSLCCALFIRLSAYLYHNSQNDSISVLSSNRDENLYRGAWYVRPELLIHMFIHLVPLKEAVSNLANILGEAIDVESTECSRLETVALVQYYCDNFPKVLGFLQAAYPLEEDLELANPRMLRIYIHSAINCYEYSKAEKLLKGRIQGQQNYNEFDFYLLGRWYEDQGQHYPALDAYTTELAILVSLRGFTDDMAIAQCYNNIGAVLSEQSKYEEALAEYRQCLSMRQRLLGEGDHLKVAEALSNIASVLSYQSKYSEAYSQFKKSLAAMLRKFGDRDHVDISDAIFNLAVILSKLSQHSDAMVEFHKCLDMRLRIYAGRDHPKIADVLLNVGMTLDEMGKYDEALIEYDKCLDMRRRIWNGSNAKLIADVIHSKGVTLRKQGKYEEAINNHQESLTIYHELFGNQDHRTIADVYCSLGVTFDDQGMHAEALAEYAKCLEMNRRIFSGKDSARVAGVLCNIGATLSEQDQDAEALEKFTEALEMRKRIYGDVDHVEIADTLCNIGAALYSLDEIQDALLTLNKSLDMLLRLFGEVNHPSICDVRENIRIIESSLMECDSGSESESSDSERFESNDNSAYHISDATISSEPSKM